MKKTIALVCCVFSCCSCPLPGPNNTTDKSHVFTKAFYLEPPEGTEIHHALLWEFRLLFGVVDQWQWHIELTPSREFREWLIEDNVFELETVLSASQFNAVEDLNPAPDWFQVETDTARFNVYQSGDGRMRLFERISDGRIFMTDYGIQQVGMTFRPTT